MIKKLRIKFIIISMLSVLFVLAVTIGAINITNYVVIENEASGAVAEVVRQGTTEQGFIPGPQGGGDRRDIRQDHYFIVSFNNDGTINKINNTHMFMYSEAECKALATQVYNKELVGGKYGTLRYALEKKNDGLTYVGFVDIKDKLDSFNNFLLLSSLISLGAFLVLFVLIFFGSKLVFKSTEEAYRKQKRFITNASHELKTPLTIISADMDLIEMDNGKSEWSDSVRDQVKRLTDMTNQLVTLSKLEEDDKLRFPMEEFSVNDVFKKAVESFSPSFKNEGIKFSSNISGNITMYGNKYLIDQLIYIFLDNSLKYTGGEQKSSYFVINEEKGKIQFRFSNTIDKDDEVDVKQIMERFYRSPSNKKEGSGVGLSIAQEIIRFHKGKIDIDKNNSTLSFVVTLNN